MRWAAAFIVFAIPLAFAPRLFFYYDVTPKVVVLLAAAACLLLWAAWKPAASLSFMTSRWGRWNAGLAACFALLGSLSAAASPVVSLAWRGSNWRRWGVVEQIAVVLCALLLAALARSSRSHLLAILRGLCAAGVLAAAYGIAQYFGIDPFLSPSTYLFGEGVYQIVRPPGPLGHSDYFAAFLLWPVFAGSALSTIDPQRAGRWLGATAGITGVAAIVLAGSRGALLGLAVGALVRICLWRPRFRVAGASLLLFAVIASGFYISPAGARLRARAFWISEDPAGGARLLLWRDSVRMSSTRPWTGFGPDNFVAEFPQFQSAELARAYPGFYHESPHNIFVDALSEQGVGGVLLLSGWIVLGLLAGFRAPPQMQPIATALLGGLVSTVVTQQFLVFVVPTAFTFYLGIGLLVGLAPGGRTTVILPVRMAAAAFCVVAAVFLATVAWRLSAADVSLARVRRALDSGDRGSAMTQWESAKSLRSTGVPADLYFSRRWAAAASAAIDPIEKLRLQALAIESARWATGDPEERQNAWYNFAMLAAAMQNSDVVESSLRAAIAASPNWFKPHWALARLLYAAGRLDEARLEALLALDLGGRKEPEVIATTAEIVRSPGPRP